MAATAHIADVVDAMRQRIAGLATPLGAQISVEIGNPANFHPYEKSTPLITIFVYRISPDNAAMVATPGSAMAVRIHTLVTVFCAKAEVEGEAPGSHELRILSHVARIFHEKPTLGPLRIREAVPVGQLVQLLAHDLYVEAQLKSPEMEEINHIWTTQAETPYRTSLVYELVHAFVTPAKPSDEGPPVLRTTLAWRDGEADPYQEGVAPYVAVDNAKPPPRQAVMAFNSGTAAAPFLVPAISLALAAQPDPVVLKLAAIAEAAEPLKLELEMWNEATLTWTTVPLGAPGGGMVATQPRTGLPINAPLAMTDVQFARPVQPAVLRLTAQRTSDPASLTVNALTITLEGPP